MCFLVFEFIDHSWTIWRELSLCKLQMWSVVKILLMFTYVLQFFKTTMDHGFITALYSYLSSSPLALMFPQYHFIHHIFSFFVLLRFWTFLSCFLSKALKIWCHSSDASWGSSCFILVYIYTGFNKPSGDKLFPLNMWQERNPSFKAFLDYSEKIITKLCLSLPFQLYNFFVSLYS